MATQGVRTVSPDQLERNPENPRLIFRADELEALQESIRTQGILVPLTVYEDGKRLVLLDGERRWRCSIKLGLPRIPVIVQPKPDRLQNIMMMFAIHNARKDWDPLPTAFKLGELEEEFTKQQGRPPRESELAEIASITRGEVRRLKNVLALPNEYKQELLEELQKPRSEQVLTVDHVLEATRAAKALQRRDVVTSDDAPELQRAIIDKFRSKVVGNTVAPRKLARIARAVEREEVSLRQAKRAARRLIEDPKYSIDQAFQDTAARADFEHEVEQLVDRLIGRLHEVQRSGGPGDDLRRRLRELRSLLRDLLA